MSKTYQSTKVCKNGHLDHRYKATGRCVTCAKAQSRAWLARDPEATKAYQAAYRAKNRDPEVEARAQDRERRRADPEYAEAHRKKKMRQANQRAWVRHRDKLMDRAVAWRTKNRGRYNAIAARYRVAKLQATPLWLTQDQLQEIDRIYATCPKGWHVDHEVPLQGENVCGLHVPWNLQHLFGPENCKKKNHF